MEDKEEEISPRRVLGSIATISIQYNSGWDKTGKGKLSKGIQSREMFSDNRLVFNQRKGMTNQKEGGLGIGNAEKYAGGCQREGW